MSKMYTLVPPIDKWMIHVLKFMDTLKISLLRVAWAELSGLINDCDSSRVETVPDNIVTSVCLQFYLVAALPVLLK